MFSASSMMFSSAASSMMFYSFNLGKTSSKIFMFFSSFNLGKTSTSTSKFSSFFSAFHLSKFCPSFHTVIEAKTLMMSDSRPKIIVISIIIISWSIIRKVPSRVASAYFPSANRTNMSLISKAITAKWNEEKTRRYNAPTATSTHI